MLKEEVLGQRRYFHTGVTRSYQFRIDALKALKRAIQKYEQDILAALQADLNKSYYEGYMTEVGLAVQEINYVLRHLRRWMRPERCAVGLNAFPGKAYRIPEPYGVVLILSPWNYPFNLTIMPLIGAIAAGNCAVLKPSEGSPHTTEVILRMLQETFTEDFIRVVTGEADLAQGLLQEKFDHIFFTGSPAIGRSVMAAAAQHLTPVTLELGGKSPCLVTADADLEAAAKSIAFGKILNAGQTCVAPDYVLVAEPVADDFCHKLADAFREQLPDGLATAGYPQVINRRHFDRLSALSADGQVVSGGARDAVRLTMEPTILREVSPTSDLMQEEIFGPLLPVLTYTELSSAVQFIASREKPLAFYLFTENRALADHLFELLSFGGACLNDTMSHLTCKGLPFGGVGNSGMGAYHGKHSFATFSHMKSLYKKSSKGSLPLKISPYTRDYRLLKGFMR